MFTHTASTKTDLKANTLFQYYTRDIFSNKRVCNYWYRTKDRSMFFLFQQNT